MPLIRARHQPFPKFTSVSTMWLKKFFKKIFSPITLFNCLGIVVLTVVLAWGGLYYLDQYTRHGESLEMPDLIGKDIVDAMIQLQKLGLKGEVVDTGYVENQAGGSVLEQNIKPGSRIKGGRVIEIVVNDWQVRKIALPSGIADNCSMREATLRLEARGLKVGPPEYIEGDKNWVYDIKLNGKSIKAGTQVSIKEPLTLVVGDGSVEEEYTGSDSLYLEVVNDSLPSELPTTTNEESLFE